MRLIAHRPLCGDYGSVTPGQEFECSDTVAQRLIADGMAHLAGPPRVIYETKVIQPLEVGPTQPFRDMCLPDQEPLGLAAPGNPVLSEPDLSKQGTPDPGGRRGRARPGAKR